MTMINKITAINNGDLRAYALLEDNPEVQHDQVTEMRVRKQLFNRQ